MKPITKSRSPFGTIPIRIRIGIAALSMALVMPPLTQAATYTWDSNASTGDGITAGSGAWNTSGLNWYNGTTDTTWVNSSSSANSATFGGTDGTYTLTLGTTPLYVNTITFLASGYTIAASSTSLITTMSGSNIINAIIAGAGKTATIGANVIFENASTGNGGNLILTGSSSTSKIIIDNGATVRTTGGAVIYIGSVGTSTSSVFGATVQVNTGGVISGINSIAVNGVLDVQGGSVSTNASLVIGSIAGTSAVANLTIESGTVTSGSGVRFGPTAGDSTAGGTLNLKGGVLAVNKVYSSGTTNKSTVNFDGGTLRATVNNTTDFLGTTINNAVVKIGGAIIDTNTYDVTISKGLAHDSSVTTDGGLTKKSTGTLNLTGSNTYNGKTEIQAGTLALGSAGSIASSSTIIAGSVSGTTATFDVSAVSGGFHLTNGQTLKGYGIVNGALTIDSGATLAAGNDKAGTLTVNNNVTFAGIASNFSIRLGVTTATDNDQLASSNSSAVSILLNGANLVVSLGANYTHIDNELYLILNNADSDSLVSGTFAQGSTITVGTETFDILYGVNYDSTGNFVSLTGGNDIALLAVPEPTTWAMLAGGFGMLVGLQRMHRRPNTIC
ncbi:MAG: autotransporter-associated beta strand repeat-containing protein [Chthoniobacteraceae bacterium]